MDFVVTAERGLRLRNRPKEESGSTTLAILPQGQPVEKVRDLDGGWMRIRTSLGGAQSIEGVVSATYLRLADPVVAPQPQATQPVPAPVLPRAHLREGRGDITRANADGRAFPVGEAGAPKRQPAGDGKAAIHAIVGWLDVERSARYAPTSKNTFCNIYAYDVAYLAGAYLPRVWWTGGALVRLARHEDVPVRYYDTVAEVSANGLYQWFADFGASFGWTRTIDVGDVQAAANAGGMGIIVARNKNPNRSGHITVVVPEDGANRAQRTGNVVHAPLQSQAGRNNHRYFAERWWTLESLAAFSFWTHP